ncbi:DUF5790 family protein [Salinibaculum rarum]|uniref:DUF5790 family protein n=1 Tax=Salinibaculum rarum TaxID=3058903 RepID=UPI00265E966B|nr:DUF5790 family protein [Salinibaculum sp. KK48]
MPDEEFDSEALFDEASQDVREKVENNLADAREAIPEANEIWEVDTDNILGVLNGLKNTLDIDGAAEAVSEAKKWYVIGDRADAFPDGEDLEAEIRDVQQVVDDLNEIYEQTSELTSSLPKARTEVDEIAGNDSADGDGSEESATDGGTDVGEENQETHGEGSRIDIDLSGEDEESTAGTSDEDEDAESSAEGKNEDVDEDSEDSEESDDESSGDGSGNVEVRSVGE